MTPAELKAKLPAVVAAFRVDDVLIAFSVEHVRETVRGLPFTEVPLAPQAVVGIAHLRGHVLAITDARERLGLAPRPGGTPVCVLLERDQRWGGVHVDSAVGVVECPPDRWQPVPATIDEGIRRHAVAVLRGDTEMLVLVDIEAMLSAKD